MKLHVNRCQCVRISQNGPSITLFYLLMDKVWHCWEVWGEMSCVGGFAFKIFLVRVVVKTVFAHGGTGRELCGGQVTSG